MFLVVPLLKHIRVHSLTQIICRTVKSTVCTCQFGILSFAVFEENVEVLSSAALSSVSCFDIF